MLSHLFGKPQIPVVPTITTIMPDIASKEIRNGRLPKLNTDTISLAPSEHCHFVDKASLVTEETVTSHYEGRRSGWSLRVMKGVTYRIGASRGIPVKKRVQEYTNGLLYITNQRIIFVAREKGFEKKVKDLTATIPYSDAVGLQFGGKTYCLLLPQSDLVVRTLRILK